MVKPTNLLFAIIILLLILLLIVVFVVMKIKAFFSKPEKRAKKGTVNFHFDFDLK